mmetsp:Transcript_1521/g.5967  ORF Transcript_1521/g.5967 Transcript_1521/m.5967 type:complete len:284 (+) Transcript_1521:1400-2251(+)
MRQAAVPLGVRRRVRADRGRGQQVRRRRPRGRQRLLALHRGRVRRRAAVRGPGRRDHRRRRGHVRAAAARGERVLGRTDLRWRNVVPELPAVRCRRLRLQRPAGGRRMPRVRRARASVRQPRHGREAVPPRALRRGGGLRVRARRRRSVGALRHLPDPRRAHRGRAGGRRRAGRVRGDLGLPGGALVPPDQAGAGRVQRQKEGAGRVRAVRRGGRAVRGGGRPAVLPRAVRPRIAQVRRRARRLEHKRFCQGRHRAPGNMCATWQRARHLGGWFGRQRRGAVD